MSYLRAQRRTINRNVYFDNRLNTFTRPPMRDGDLFVDNYERVGGNMDINGNLTIGGQLSATSFYANRGNFYLDNYLLIPYGTIIQCAAVNVPQGWLLCNGASILKNSYLNLYNAIGYTYGGFDNNFNVPDIRGRVPIGSGSGAGLTNRILGNIGGAERHQLTVDEMPAHTHTENISSGNLPIENDTPDVYNNQTSSYTGNTGSTGGDQSHNNMQPFIVLNYLIKY